MSILSAIVVGTCGVGTHWFLLPHERALLTHAFMGDFIAALSTAIVSLVILIRREEDHFLMAIACVISIFRLNHDLRKELFQLCLAVQKIGEDKQTPHLTEQAVERISNALREATADAISGRSGTVRESSRVKAPD